MLYTEANTPAQCQYTSNGFHNVFSCKVALVSVVWPGQVAGPGSLFPIHIICRRSSSETRH